MYRHARERSYRHACGHVHSACVSVVAGWVAVIVTLACPHSGPGRTAEEADIQSKKKTRTRMENGRPAAPAATTTVEAAARESTTASTAAAAAGGGSTTWCGGDARRGRAFSRQGVARRGEARRGEARRGEARQVWCDMVRCGEAELGMAWCGRARRGVVCQGKADVSGRGMA